MSITFLKRGALMLAAASFLSALPLASAEAQYYRRNYTGEALVGGAVGGLVGGLAAGAILNANRPVYHPPVYSAPRPVIVEEAPAYHSDGPYLRERGYYWTRPRLARAPDLEVVPSCYMQRQRVWVDRYTYTHRYTRICD